MLPNEMVNDVIKFIYPKQFIYPLSIYPQQKSCKFGLKIEEKRVIWLYLQV
jgi:hypothetical protein